MSNYFFDELKKKFNKHKFRLYMIGSASRDYILGREINDYDFVTDATPNEISKFLDVDLTFAQYGVVKFKFEKYTADIVTLRKEYKYLDQRHPTIIEFVKDIEIDYKRRDFTINAIYIDEDYNIIDPANGVEDLNNKVLRMIGDPFFRIKEDPLRILRADRFKYEYNLKVDPKLHEAIEANRHLLSRLQPNKIKEELKKIDKFKLGGEKNK